MAEIELFSELVGRIYDAGLDSSLWPRALKALCQFLPSACANIFIQDANNRYANSVFTYGVEARYLSAYLETYAKINPLFPEIFFRPVGEVFSTFDIMPRKQFQRTRLYKEWVEPQNLYDSVAAVLEKSATSCAIVAAPLDRRHDSAAAATRERMRLVVPHIARAVLIGRAFDLEKTNADNLAATVDALAAAIYLVGPERQIAHVNRKGEDMLAADDALYLIGRRLHAYDNAVNESLGELFVSSASGDDLAVGSRGIALHLPSRSGNHYVAHVLPLSAGARRDTARHRNAAALLVVHDATQSVSSSPEVLAKAFGLTAREVGVLLSIIEVGGVPAVAEVLGLAQATVRAHLRQIFAKTGAARQADLARLVGQFATPVG